MVGIRSDLRERLCEAHQNRTCLVAQSASEAHRLRSACRRKDVLCPAPQVYALPELWDELKPPQQERYRLRALAQLHPDWVFTSYSAAVMHGLEVSYRLLGDVHVMTSLEAHSRSSHAIRRHIMKTGPTVRIDDVPVTSLVRTSFDCIRSCHFPEGLAIADSTLRLSGMAKEELIEAFKQTRGRHVGRWRALDTVAWADPRAENGGESVARAVMIREGFLLPDLQFEIPDVFDGRQGYRVDFYWRLASGNVVGELDGKEKYRDPQMTGGRDMVEVLSDERLRESRLTGADVKVMRFSYADVVKSDRFCRLMTAFGIPSGYAVPDVALT